MTVLDFIRQHPAQAVDVISSVGCDHVTSKRSLALARDQPEDMEILDWTVCHSSFSGGAWHVLAIVPALEQDAAPRLAMA
ncbi:hypothetical protein [Oscillibacter sp. CU971]|jgi:hypothetical protein|uniref:hypothetical protein n=1 Tax=Oscillibacter sp. CU971 TaxID=2780102 RepID=UPI00195F00BE|nr:hypothetical protein [Oscillibacter sp. CU971]